MRQVLLSGRGEVEVFDVPAPLRAPGGVLVRTLFSLISSGTEGAAVATHRGWLGVLEKARRSPARVEQVWKLARTQGLLPTWELLHAKLADYTPLGYSAVGEVIEVDDPSGPFRVGQVLVCTGSGVANHAEFLAVPQNLALPVPAGVAPEEAAFGAIGCIAMQGIRRLEAQPGEWIGVIGLGLIGQVAVRLARAMGYQVCAIDRLDDRVALAGANGSEAWSLPADSVRRALDLTSGRGLDGVVVCAATQSDEPVNLAFDLCRQRGRVSIVGDVGLGLRRDKMYRKELELRMSTSYGPGRYDPTYEEEGRDYPVGLVRWTARRNLEHFLLLLADRRLDLRPLISARFPVQRAGEAYARIKAGNSSDFGVLFEYSASVAAGPERIQRASARPQQVAKGQGPIRLGLIGVGAYAKGTHLPNLHRLSRQFELVGVASRTGTTAAVAARRWRIPVVTSDYHELLADPSIEAVLISTRHASHAAITCAALDAGKHVFVEKPLAVTVEQARQVGERAQAAERVVRVGFNRRFSPWVGPLRQALGSSGRRLVTMRVNVGDIGAHWSNAAEEGGRLVGEGVHFFDLANWLLGQPPSSVSATFVGSAQVDNPNASVTIHYPDGSLAQVHYTTLGSTAMGKEYFEVFGNGRSAWCDDYKRFASFGVEASVGRATQGDKGQLGTLAEFGRAVRGEPSEISGADAQDGLLATWMALAAFESATLGAAVSRPEE